jgi:WbqC-like protein family.
MKAAIIQSNYLPWRGYFDIIHDVDVFVFLEDVQYTHRDWRNRNKVKTAGGVKWISVPVLGGINQFIYEARIDYSQAWQEKHRQTLHHSYAAAPYYESYKSEILEIYSHSFESLSELNMYSIKKIAKILGIETQFINAKDLHAPGTKDEKLINICQMVGADSYLSGPAAKNYIADDRFSSAEIELAYMDYSGYPDYHQLWGNFEPAVSIIDVLFNCGEKSPYYIWGWRNEG